MRSTRLAMAVSLTVSLCAQAAQPGDELKPVELRDASDNPAQLPDFGKKVLTIFYTDADVADMNDPLGDALKEKKISKDLHNGFGIVNLKDSKAPNFIIRRVVKSKIEKYNITVLTDPELLLPTAWGLGECNNTSVVQVVGKDGKLKHLQRGPIRGADVEKLVQLIEQLSAEI